MKVKKFKEIFENNKVPYEDKIIKWKKSSIFQRKEWLSNIGIPKNKIEEYSKNNHFNLLPIDVVMKVKMDKEYSPTKKDNYLNVSYFQQILNKSNGLSISERKYIQSILNTIKKNNGKATLRQKSILNDFRKGIIKK